jgi:hypothetical protein
MHIQSTLSAGRPGEVNPDRQEPVLRQQAPVLGRKSVARQQS